MTQCKRVGIDTSKSVFTVHGIDEHDRPVLRLNLGRARMKPFFKKPPPTEIAMEARGASHHWAGRLTDLGHDVRLLPPRYVKPYVKRIRNDRDDAAAIRQAAGRPGMRFVPVKSLTQQAQGMVLKVRESLIEPRTATANTLRGHAAESGIVSGKGAGTNETPFWYAQADRP
jgi:transposase